MVQWVVRLCDVLSSVWEFCWLLKYGGTAHHLRRSLQGAINLATIITVSASGRLFQSGVLLNPSRVILPPSSPNFDPDNAALVEGKRRKRYLASSASIPLTTNLGPKTGKCDGGDSGKIYVVQVCVELSVWNGPFGRPRDWVADAPAVGRVEFPSSPVENGGERFFGSVGSWSGGIAGVMVLLWMVGMSRSNVSTRVKVIIEAGDWLILDERGDFGTIGWWRKFRESV
ncbi:hypothetical protein L218DRAFT_951190 [Marasmius fiardii PR-910]|nr:hypothetical protein L218DRAFT_951190 [Marasmius fiardii PR-910]